MTHQGQSTEANLTESARSVGKFMAIAGLVCSLGVPLLLVVLFLVAMAPSTSETAGGVFLALLLAGPILWLAGLVLSLLAKGKTLKYRKLARVGIIVSAISPLLFIGLVVVLFLLVVDWYFNDFFTLGVSIGASSAI